MEQARYIQEHILWWLWCFVKWCLHLYLIQAQCLVLHGKCFWWQVRHGWTFSEVSGKECSWKKMHWYNQMKSNWLLTRSHRWRLSGKPARSRGDPSLSRALTHPAATHSGCLVQQGWVLEVGSTGGPSNELGPGATQGDQAGTRMETRLKRGPNPSSRLGQGLWMPSGC